MDNTPLSSLGQHKLQASYSFQSSRRGPKRALLVLAILVLIGVGAFFGSQYLGSKETSLVPTPTSQPLPTQELLPTEAPTPTTVKTTLSPTQASGPTAKPTANPVDKASGLDRSTLSVAVQNGSGQVGAASKASDILKSFGYKVASTGNADSFNYEETVILVKSTKSGFVALLKNDLSSTYTIGSSSATLSASESADAVVIVGKE